MVYLPQFQDTIPLTTRSINRAWLISFVATQTIHTSAPGAASNPVTKVAYRLNDIRFSNIYNRRMSTQTPLLDPIPLRAQFPALQLEVNGKTAVYLDGPGGTQVPQRVIDAISEALTVGISNHGGPFFTSARSDAIVEAARVAMMDFYNARRPEEIVFGQNMTSLTFAISRAIARAWQPGDEIILTRLDHDANSS
jgi:hypothetical protein